MARQPISIAPAALGDRPFGGHGVALIQIKANFPRAAENDVVRRYHTNATPTEGICHDQIRGRRFRMPAV